MIMRFDPELMQRGALQHRKCDWHLKVAPLLTGLERPGLPLDIDRFPSKPVHPQVTSLYHYTTSL